MNDFWEIIKQLTDPESIIKYGGLTLLLSVIFAETGLLIGFFLPGDSLIFIAGVICASRPELLHTHIITLEVYMMLSAIAGNVAAYWFGKKVGTSLLNKPDSIIFKKSYVEITQKFYEKNGGKTLVIGRFLPIIRTFAPILAGVIKIDLKKFMLYNIIGAILWIGTLSSIGYRFGRFKWVQDHIGWIVVFLIVITMVPIIITIGKRK